MANNRDLQKYIDKYKINWVDEEDMIRKLMVQIRDSNDYIDYLAKTQNSYHNDKDIFIKIIKKHLSRSEILQFYYEEKSIYWSDDFHTANLLAIKTIKSYESSWDEMHKLPLIFGKEIDGSKNEDKEFVVNLFRKTMLRSEEYEKLIDEKVKN